MSSKDEILKVPKLLKDGSNWVMYRDRLRWILRARKLLSHIESGVPGSILSLAISGVGEKGKATDGEGPSATEISKEES